MGFHWSFGFPEQERKRKWRDHGKEKLGYGCAQIRGERISASMRWFTGEQRDKKFSNPWVMVF